MSYISKMGSLAGFAKFYFGGLGEFVEVVLEMVEHALAELFLGAVFEELDQVEVGDLAHPGDFFEGDQVAEDGEEHGLKALQGVVPGHLVDLAVEGDLVVDAEGDAAEVFLVFGDGFELFDVLVGLAEVEEVGETHFEGEPELEDVLKGALVDDQGVQDAFERPED